MLHRVATKEREEIKRTIKQNMARRLNKEGGNHLEQEGNRQKTMEDMDGWLHPAVDVQSLGERWKVKSYYRWYLMTKNHINHSTAKNKTKQKKPKKQNNKSFTNPRK